MNHSAPVQSEASTTEVLLIDDHPAFSRLVELFANKWGKGHYKVTAVNNMESALATLQDRAFHIVLLDGRLHDDRSPGENSKTVSDHFSGPIILFSGLNPIDFETSVEYQNFAGTISKDDLPKESFIDRINAFIAASAKNTST